MICPKCKNNRAHRSHRTFSERVIGWVGFKPYRCKECKHRFYAYRGGERSEKLRSTEERRIMALRRKIKWKRTKGELVLYAVGLVVMLVLIRYLMTLEPPPPGG